MNNPHDIESGPLSNRMRGAVSLAWSIFAKKVGGKLININKEASMQLHFGCILQHLLPLINFNKDEKLQLELETGVKVDSSMREIDVRVNGWMEQVEKMHRIAVELKCYRTIASSGGKRGATDIFMKDVYED